jgi:hypothetical protein
MHPTCTVGREGKGQTLAAREIECAACVQRTPPGFPGSLTRQAVPNGRGSTDPRIPGWKGGRSPSLSQRVPGHPSVPSAAAGPIRGPSPPAPLVSPGREGKGERGTETRWGSWHWSGEQRAGSSTASHLAALGGPTLSPTRHDRPAYTERATQVPSTMVHCCTLWISSRECSRVAPRRRWPVRVGPRWPSHSCRCRWRCPQPDRHTRSRRGLRSASCSVLLRFMPAGQYLVCTVHPVPRLAPVLVLRTRLASADSRLAREAEEVHPQLVNSGARLRKE